MSGAGSLSLRRVGVIDDDPMTARLVCTLLELDGYRARHFLDSPNLPDDLLQAGVGVVICDNRMPGRSGSEVVALLRADPRFGAVRAVLMSGLPLEERVWREQGADAFLLKPFTHRHLLAAMTAAGVWPLPGAKSAFTKE
jgi:two-component system alkaline phosphatase synthesis response regulator PhoP